jgi:hypothetical protein
MAEEVTNGKQKKRGKERETIGQAKRKLGTTGWQEERVQKKQFKCNRKVMYPVDVKCLDEG